MTRLKSPTESQEPSDEALVLATRQGDRDAYRTLVERYQERVFLMALDILKNREDAEDVAQETFVKAFLSLDKFKGDSSFFTWLYRIAFNMAIDVRRKTGRRGGHHIEYKESFGVSGLGTGDSDVSGEHSTAFQNIDGPHEALVRKEAGRKIHEVLSQLSDEHRAVITLREIDGLNYEEISEALGIPRGTVMSRLFYARKALQRALEEFAPENSGHSGNDSPDESKTNGENDKRLKRSLG